MLCALALDPFFQQVVDFPDRWALQDVISTIPKVVRYEPIYSPDYVRHEEQGSQDKDLGTVVRDFFMSNGTQPMPFGNGTRPDIPLTCPTSNCTWPAYDTFAVCSQCVDVSNTLDITFACINTTIDWSANWTGPITDDPYANGTVCGHFLNVTSDIPTLLSGYILTQGGNSSTTGEALMMRAIPLTDFDTKQPLYADGSINFKNIQYPILDALFSSTPAGLEGVYQHDAPVVHECMLSWCVQTIESTYTMGVYSENINATYLDISEESTPWPWEVFEGETGTNIIYGPNITLQAPQSPFRPQDVADNKTTFGLSNITAYGVLAVFDDFLPSSYTAEDISTPPMLRYKNYFDGPSTRHLEFNPWLAPNNVTRHMERLATSMTNVIRSSVSKEMVIGEAYSKENFVEVRWQWLTLPLGLLFISLIFLAATIAKSAVELDRVGVYKTSAYATLLFGLPDEMQKSITRSASTGTPRSKAKELKVRLQPNHGWRISGNLFSPFTPKPRQPQPPPGWI